MVKGSTKQVCGEQDEWFRVRVCLEQFFSDERARCLVGVRAARPVRWLRRRLRRLFPLPRGLALLCRGHLLPPDEPLALLRPDDEVLVVPKTTDWEDETETNETPIEPIIVPTPERTRKRKRNSSNQQCYFDNEVKAIEETADAISPASLHRKETTESLGTDRSHAESDLLLECNVTANIVTPSSNNDEMISNPSKTDPLNDMKKHALALLDSCLPAPRRRRVRRRRPRRAPALLPEPLADSKQDHEDGIDQLDEVDKYAKVDNTSEVVQCAETNQSVETVSESVVRNQAESSISSDLPIFVQKDAIAPTILTQDPIVPAPVKSPVLSASPTSLPLTLSWIVDGVPLVPSVLRNETVGPRVPRVVRPLPNNAP